MAYVSFIHNIIDINSHCVQISVYPTIEQFHSGPVKLTAPYKDNNKSVIPESLYKYVKSVPARYVHQSYGDSVIEVYLLDTPQEEIIQDRRIKFDFTNEFKDGKPILQVQKLAVKRPDGTFFYDVWDVSVEPILEELSKPRDKLLGRMNNEPILPPETTLKLFTLQTMMIKDLQEKVNALTPQEKNPVVEEKSDPFEEEVQRRLAKELYEQRVNAEVHQRLKAMSVTKTEDGINKVFEEWKGIPIFKDIASLLKP